MKIDADMKSTTGRELGTGIIPLTSSLYLPHLLVASLFDTKGQPTIPYNRKILVKRFLLTFPLTRREILTVKN